MNSTINDSLKNLATGLGDTKYDKIANTSFIDNLLTDDQIRVAFKNSWIVHKAVTIPGHDALRKGRDWQATEKQITLIEREERRLRVVPKLLECLWKARLWGGAGIIIGGGKNADDYSEPFEPTSVGKGGLTHLTVMTCHQLVASELDTDVTSEWYGKPKNYTISISGQNASSVTVHPSRVAAFVGDSHPDPWGADTSVNLGWGVSVLSKMYTAVLHAESSLANTANLLFESNVDEIGIPGLMDLVGDAEYRSKFHDRMQLSALMKSSLRAVVHDSDETYNRHAYSFAGLADILDRFLLVVSGATDIPLTRFLGQSPSGLSSTGEHDMANYHDMISSMQSLEIEPNIFRLDDALITSALGVRDPDVFYTWSPLKQMDEKSQSEIAKSDAEVAEIYSRTGIFGPDELRDVTSNRLIETGFYPGLAATMGDVDVDYGFNETKVSDAAPRTLYVRRNVINGDEIVAWAKSQGFGETMNADDMHVTIAFSRTAVDWFEIGESWGSDIEIKEGGPRAVERLGESGDAVVLLVSSSELTWRHDEMIEKGCSWDHPEYQPHVTIAYDPLGTIDVSKIEPFTGVIRLGPEVFQEVDLDWKRKIRQS